MKTSKLTPANAGNSELSVAWISMVRNRLFGGFVVICFYQQGDNFQYDFPTLELATDFIRGICEQRIPAECVSLL